MLNEHLLTLPGMTAFEKDYININLWFAFSFLERMVGFLTMNNCCLIKNHRYIINYIMNKYKSAIQEKLGMLDITAYFC